MSARTRSRHCRCRPQHRLRLEPLEDRTLLDAGFVPGTQLLLVTHAGALQTVRFDDTASAQQALTAYQAGGLYRSVEFDQVVSINVIPNDPSFNQLWGLHNTAQFGGTLDADIDAPEAWDITQGKAAFSVGVLDTGIDYQHQDLYRNIWINQEEIPGNVRSQVQDVDADGQITFWDLNDPVNIGPGKITDLNGTGYIDGGDLLFSLAQGGWADGIDQDPYIVGTTTYNRVDDLIGWNFVANNNNPLDDHDHGTHVSGTIGAMGNNALGVVGVNWRVQIAALKFLDAGGEGSFANATLALDYATANGIKVTNNSWGDYDFSSAFADALTRANNAGYLFIAAAGNNGWDNDIAPVYPASYPHANVLSVASSTHTDARSSFSNFGATSVDLAAPGDGVLSTTRNNLYSVFGGTSMASPHVAGAVALLWGQEPTLTAAQIRTRLLGSVDVLPAWSGVVASGGRLNVHRLLNATPGLPTVSIVASDATAAEVNTGSNPGTFTVSRTGATTAALTVNFAVSGTASSGDYAAIGTSVTIAAGQASATITISPVNDTLVEPTETVILTISANAAYTVGSPSSATVNILDNDNTPPVLQPIADRNVLPSQQVLSVTLVGSDADGHSLTYSATAQSLAYVLDQQYALTTDGNYYENAYGRQEKWVQGSGTGWYFLLPNGELYQWHGGVPEAQGTLLGNVGTSYYDDPTRLTSAPVNQPRATLSVSGNVLTITRDLSWTSAIVVTASVSDNFSSDSKTFRVTVGAAAGNNPPVLQNPGDRTITAAQQPAPITLSATDADGDPITYTATAQSLAYVLRTQYALTTDGNDYFNAWGRNEKWVQGSGTGWYFILATGELYQWDGVLPAVNGTLLGNVGTSYYQDINRLVTAPVNQPRATLSVSGNVLTITRDLSWVSALVVTATASDGRGGSDSEVFRIIVTA